jgi:hypothetical protein
MAAGSDRQIRRPTACLLLRLARTLIGNPVLRNWKWRRSNQDGQSLELKIWSSAAA